MPEEGKNLACDRGSRHGLGAFEAVEERSCWPGADIEVDRPKAILRQQGVKSGGEN